MGAAECDRRWLLSWRLSAKQKHEGQPVHLLTWAALATRLRRAAGLPCLFMPSRGRAAPLAT